MTTYAYRLAARIPSGRMLSVPEEHDGKFDLDTANPTRLTVPTTKDGDDVVLVGHGFRTEDQAWAAGEAARSALRIGALSAGVPVDLGIEREKRDRPRSALADSIRQKFIEENGHRVLNDVLGLQVYPEDLPVSLFRARAQGTVSMPADRMIEPLQTALGSGCRLDKRHALAIDLYFLAQFLQWTRAKFLALVTALEVLSTRKKRSDPMRAHIDHLIELTKQARGDADPGYSAEIGRFLSSLGALKRESITDAIRAVVRDNTDDAEQYAAMPPAEFAAHCYQVRSKLVHDGEEPDDVQLSQLHNELQRLVRSVLFEIASVDD